MEENDLADEEIGGVPLTGAVPLEHFRSSVRRLFQSTESYVKLLGAVRLRWALSFLHVRIDPADHLPYFAYITKQEN